MREKIIGRTKSGKPIYASHSHPDHENFTAKDHSDASELHKENLFKSFFARGKFEGDETAKLSGGENHSRNQMFKHHELALVN